MGLPKRQTYILIPEEVLYRDRLTHADKIVYGVMLAFSRPEGLCFASAERIADRAHVSIATVYRCIDSLEINGCIKEHTESRKRGGYKGGRTKAYTLTFQVKKSPPKLFSMPKRAAAN